jgi:hypothetical protein
MKKLLIVIVFLFTISSLVLAQSSKSASPSLSAGLSIGYDIGMPIQAHFLILDLAEGLPLGFRFNISHSFLLDPGNPEEARHVFINENTNGVPDKSASRWTFGFDFLHRVNILSLNDAFLFAGIRYSRFTGTFDFIGGNEYFDVRADQWGLGVGIESHFKMSAKLDLLFSLGAEYFFPSTLEGHDSAYSSDGEYVNRRENYTYTDADHAINQPKLIPKLLIGIDYHF